jgi:Zn-dependent protease
MHKSYVLRTHSGRKLLQTSNIEIKDLLVAWLLISLAFAIARTAGSGLSVSSVFTTGFLLYIVISAVTVGIAFLLHELAHKIVAQRYKCWAEFRSDIRMLGFGLLLSLTGFIFIAPGAVMIYGHITKQQNGKIAAAGPVTNIIIAILMLPLLFVNFSSAIITEIIRSGFYINAFLALFNMIPFLMFDGAKIWSWNKVAYFSIVGVSIILIVIYSVIMASLGAAV